MVAAASIDLPMQDLRQKEAISRAEADLAAARRSLAQRNEELAAALKSSSGSAATGAV